MVMVMVCAGKRRPDLLTLWHGAPRPDAAVQECTALVRFYIHGGATLITVTQRAKAVLAKTCDKSSLCFRGCFENEPRTKTLLHTTPYAAQKGTHHKQTQAARTTKIKARKVTRPPDENRSVHNAKKRCFIHLEDSKATRANQSHSSNYNGKQPDIQHSWRYCTCVGSTSPCMMLRMET